MNDLFQIPKLSAADAGGIIIIADDLTGACDTGAAFLRSGLQVRVWTGAEAAFDATETVQVFNTDSRALSSRGAARAVSQTIAGLHGRPGTLYFKKVDSAGRGQLGAEILAAHRALKTQAVLFAPAFPANGRTVQNGVLHITDAAGQRTQIQLPSLFPGRVRRTICTIQSPEQLAPALRAGKQILICDTLDQRDLVAFARRATDFVDILFAGSAGLANALAQLHLQPHVPREPHRGTPVMIIAGSIHPVTQLQLTHFETNSSSSAQLLRVADFSPVSNSIAAAFRECAPKSLVVTGGDTALLVARALGAHSFILQGELAPGIPWGLMQGGEADGCTIVTKSGGFGSPAVLSEIVTTLQGNK